jgi:hypothetical protein
VPEHEVKYAARFLKRHINKAIQRSYLKALAEPITNSHDSYIRLEEDAVRRGDAKIAEAPKPILIYVDRRSKRLRVIDYAEGISRDEMLEKFLEYGEEKGGQEKGYRVRALFGQGLADVMFSQVRGIVHSIKDTKYCYAKFKWRKKQEHGRLIERQVIDIPDDSTHATLEIRQQHHIPPPNNGTVAEFTFVAHFPQEEKIVERLSNFYMLRLVNSDAKRIVRAIFTEPDGKVSAEHPIKYSFPTGELVGELNTSFVCEGFSRVQVVGKLYRFQSALTQSEAGDDREGGLLTYEGQSVFDLTLFGYDDNPYACQLFGTLELQGASKIIRAKLNQPEPEEILTESRNGFDRKHPFYLQLRSTVDPWLKDIVDKERRRTESETSVLSDETRKRHQRAFDKLNELYRELNDDVVTIGPPDAIPPRPTGGLQFERDSVTVTAMRKYAIRLFVDCTVIEPGETVCIESDNPDIRAIPPTIAVVKPAKGEVLARAIIVTGSHPTNGKVSAKVRDRVAHINVEVVPATEYSPTKAVEFYPSDYRSQSGRRNGLDLYINPTEIPVGSRIDLQCDNPNIALETTATIFSAADLQSNGIARTVFYYRGVGEGQKAIVQASVSGYTADASIQIVSKAEPPKRPRGKFSGWDYQPLEVPFQTFYDSDTGKIIVNAVHPLNKSVFGASKAEAERRVEKLPHCQTALAELILEECLAATLFKAYRENKVDRRYEDDPFNDIRRYIAEKKREIGLEIYRLFVNEKLVRELINNLGAEMAPQQV